MIKTAVVQRPVLEARQLCAAYDKAPVLGPIDLILHEGDRVGILGHNGMGKTTLVRTLMGLLNATRGSIRINQQDWTTMPEFQRARKGVAYVPQGRGILPALSAYENLTIACREGDINSHLSRVLSLLPRVKPMLSRPGGSLSGGEQQILALARAMISDPWLLILDEPTEGIQPSIIEEIATTLALLGKEQRLTVLVVEQNLDFLLDCTNRLLVLQRGLIVDELTAPEMQCSERMMSLSQLGAARTTRS